MANSNMQKLYQILDAFEKAGKDKRKITKARKLVDVGNIEEALKKIRELNTSNTSKSSSTSNTSKTAKTKKGESNKQKDTAKTKKKQENVQVATAKKKSKKKVETQDKTNENEKEIETNKITEETQDEEYFDELEEKEDREYYNDYEDEYNTSQEMDNEYDIDEDNEEIDDLNETNNIEPEEDESEEDYGIDDYEDGFGTFDNEDEEEKPKYKEEVKKQESVYPEKLRNEIIEKAYIGLLLNNPKLIVKYYIVFEECYFDDPSLLNIYKSILFTEGGNYTPEIAKKGFNFSVDNNENYAQKQDIKNEIRGINYNPEKVYLELRKLCTLRKSYLEEPREDIQQQIVGIRDYQLYDQMSVEEVKAAIVQVSVTQKFKHAVLSEDLTEFLEKGENNLTNGLELPFPILSSVFKGIRKGETMAFAMPSNSGKSRFTINLAAYVAFVHRQKVLIISNEMSEEKMKLCLITTVLNNPKMQELHGQKITKTEGELLEFKFRPDKGAKVKTDEDGFILQEEKETRKEFVERLKKVSLEFNKTIAVTDWLNNQINNSIYFINITDHTNDELKKVIMNYYYKEKIEYVFYDTLKTDTANIGNGEEIKRTATILSNLAQNFNMFICSTLQLTESTTLPINLNVNDLAVSRTVKEVLDTLCLIKQIMREDWDKYQYSLEEVDTKFFEFKKYTDPDERYYACVVDKNRAGAKPKLLFNLNLAYNRWNELGYLRLKVEK